MNNWGCAILSNVQRIKELAKERGIRMGYIYEKIGCSRSKFSDVESGKSSISEREYAIIANILNTTPEYLKGETDTKDTKEKPATSQDDELISALKDPQIMKLVKRLYDAPKEERDRLERIIDAALGNPK